MGQTLSYIFPRKTIEISERELALKIFQSKYCIVLTGAGASAESNVPTFRDPSEGIWRKHSITECGTIWGFKRHPEKLWWLLSDCVRDINPVPNPTHYAIAELERLGKVKRVITQNVDNLHQDAGSRNVIEYHGNLMQAECMKCGKLYPMSKELVISEEFRSQIPPHCKNCGGILKPTVILFGEWIPGVAATEAADEARKCDLFLVVGTSANIAPCSGLPYSSQRHGAVVVEVNVEHTSLTNRVSDFILLGKSSRLQDVANHVKELMKEAGDPRAAALLERGPSRNTARGTLPGPLAPPSRTDG